MMNFFIVSSTLATYAETACEAAMLAGGTPWNCATVTRAISALKVGDELAIHTDVSVFRLSGIEIEYKGIM